MTLIWFRRETLRSSPGDTANRSADAEHNLYYFSLTFCANSSDLELVKVTIVSTDWWIHSLLWMNRRQGSFDEVPKYTTSRHIAINKWQPIFVSLFVLFCPNRRTKHKPNDWTEIWSKVASICDYDSIVTQKNISKQMRLSTPTLLSFTCGKTQPRFSHYYRLSF